MIVTVPGCSPTTATQRTAGASTKLPFGLPYGAGLIWNGMVTAADASATDVRVETITTDVQTLSRRTGPHGGLQPCPGDLLVFPDVTFWS